MRKIIITTDSTADVTPELKKEFGLETMRFSLKAGNACFPDRVDQPDKTLSLIDMTGGAKKIIIPPQRTDYEDFFDELAEKDCDVIHVSQGQAWSAAYKNAMAAAKNTMVKFRNRLIFVADSRGTAAGQALILDSALSAKAKGESPEEIFSLVDRAFFAHRAIFYSARPCEIQSAVPHFLRRACRKFAFGCGCFDRLRRQYSFRKAVPVVFHRVQKHCRGLLRRRQ